MKKLTLLLLVSFVLVSFLTAETVTAVRMSRNTNQRTVSRNEEIFVQETFENGMGNWVAEDATLPSQQWHLTNNANLTHGGTGYSWYMGNPDLGTNGGYTDGLLIYVQTPEITVPATNANLTFNVNWAVEELGGTQGYDGWDGANVRISTNGGSTWTVISPVSPAYNSTSMYGFGYNGEGEGVPGWGDTSNGWQLATFDLSAYSGQSVMIRWVFGSDPGYNTTNDPSLFGIVVDNISLGSFNHNFNDNNPQGMTTGSSVPVGGQLWHIGTYSPAPSPTHVMKLSNDQNTYNPNMMNYIYSDLYTLPNNGLIRADFMIRGSFEDPDYDPNATLDILDYWGWQISPDAGTTWYAMSNPYGAPGGQNFVYVDAPDDFVFATESYNLDGYISEYAGQTVQFRWYFKSDGDAPIGEGIMIDDFTIFHVLELDAPKNLTAELHGSSVILNWDDPSATDPVTPGWISHSGNDYHDAIGTNAAAQFHVAHRFTPAQLADLTVAGGLLTKVAFMPHEPGATYTVKVWTGGTTVANAGTLVAEQAVTQNLTMDAWNEVVLTTPVNVPVNQEIRIGYHINTPSGYPAGIDNTATVEGFGNLIDFGGWNTLVGLADITGNWLIKGFVDVAGRTLAIGNVENTPVTETTFASYSNATLSASGIAPAIKSNRDITGYKIYRKNSATGSFAEIGQVAGTVTTFTDNSPVSNAINYYAVTAVYGADESAYSNEAQVFIPSPTTYLYAYDDGTAESGLTYAGTALNIFAPVIHPNENRYKITHASVYIEQKLSNAIVLKIFNENNNQPNEEIYSQTITAALLNEGWNVIPLNNIPALEMTEGRFYMGFQVTNSSSKIGVDNSTSGMSFNKTSAATSYSVYNGGVFMIRAYVDRFTSTDDVVAVESKLTAKNYPNPFNPETKISFNMPVNGHVSVQVYNVKGQLVNTLLNQEVKSGQNSVVWNGLDNTGKKATSGVYFYKVETENSSVVNKMLLMK